MVHMAAGCSFMHGLPFLTRAQRQRNAKPAPAFDGAVDWRGQGIGHL